MPLKIYLLRHGETEWSLNGRHTGVTDIPLTARGEEEARSAGTFLRDLSFQRVITSPRLRAKRTAEIAGFGSKAEVSEDLREWTYGEYEGLLIHEIRARHPGWNIFDHGCPGGETPEQVLTRANRLLNSLKNIDGNVLLVSHGHFTRVLALAWTQLPISQGAIFGSATASISCLELHGKSERPILSLWNCTPGHV